MIWSDSESCKKTGTRPATIQCVLKCTFPEEVNGDIFDTGQFFFSKSSVIVLCAFMVFRKVYSHVSLVQDLNIKVKEWVDIGQIPKPNQNLGSKGRLKQGSG